MDYSKMVKWLAENLKIEAECAHTGELNNQVVQVTLKLGGTTISKSHCEVLVKDNVTTSRND